MPEPDSIDLGTMGIRDRQNSAPAGHSLTAEPQDEEAGAAGEETIQADIVGDFDGDEADEERDERAGRSADASEDETPAEEDDASDDEIDLDKETDPAKLRAFAKKAKSDAEELENKRRSWQRTADQYRDLADQAIAEAKRAVTTDSRTDAPAAEDDLLAGLKDDEMLTVADFKGVLNRYEQRQRQQQQQQSAESRKEAIKEAVMAHDDADAVITHFDESGLSRHPDAKLLNQLGMFYLGKADRLEKANAQLTKDLEAARKKARGGKEGGGERNKAAAPPVDGGSQDRPAPGRGRLSPAMQAIQQKRERIARNAGRIQ